MEHQDLETEAKHETIGRSHMESQGWSAFATVIGDFYLAAGVNGGCVGRLFDLTPLQVEDLVKSAGFMGVADDAIDEEKPLLSFAVIACWVLQTLAHHSSEPDVWIPLCNDLAGLVNMAAETTAEDPVVVPTATLLLEALISVYESLRQCGPEGHVTRQLGYRYEKSLRRLLRSDWDARFARLKEGVAMHAMELVLYSRFKQYELPTRAHQAADKVSFLSARRDAKRKSSFKHRQALEARELQEEREAAQLAAHHQACLVPEDSKDADASQHTTV